MIRGKILAVCLVIVPFLPCAASANQEKCVALKLSAGNVVYIKRAATSVISNSRGDIGFLLYADLKIEALKLEPAVAEYVADLRRITLHEESIRTLSPICGAKSLLSDDIVCFRSMPELNMTIAVEMAAGTSDRVERIMNILYRHISNRVICDERSD